ncbi:MAG: CDP-6-deoxy-delta-3,4-glucoseen reductase [Sedimenticola sp.]
MSFRVKVEPSGHEFTAEPNEAILDAAEHQGVSLPYGCRNGVCGNCSGTLVAGSIAYPDEGGAIVDSAGESCLTCQAIADSDIVIHVKEVESIKEIKIRTLPTKVERLEQLTGDVMRLYLSLPEGQRMPFLAGQYLDFIMDDGHRRAFSMANAPHNDTVIELHIRHIDGGKFTGHVFSSMKVGDIQTIQAPMGGFYLREESERPLIFMAGGTGFAPLKAIIEHAIHTGLNRPVHLYWGVRSSSDLYLNDLAQSWADSLKGFSYTPVLSEPEAGWSGTTGWVHEAVVADHPEMSRFDLYMSGPPPMVFAGKRAFIDAGILEENIYSDVFEWAKDSPDKG